MPQPVEQLSAVDTASAQSRSWPRSAIRPAAASHSESGTGHDLGRAYGWLNLPNECCYATLIGQVNQDLSGESHEASQTDDIGIAAVTTGAMVIQTAGLASAADVPRHDRPSVSVIVDDIGDALTEQGVSQGTGSDRHGSVSVDLPDSGTEAASASTPAGVLTLDLPARGRDLSNGDDDVRLFDGTGKDTAVAVQNLGSGVRALVHIDSANAPERYDFPVSGDVASLRLTADGGVEALSAAHRVIATAPAPWAVDAAGVEVPTHYEVHGRTLTQVVEHRGGNYAYGIVADPSFWAIARCVAAITFVLGSASFMASKIVKIRGAIKALGGVKATAKLLVGATSMSEKLSELGKAGMAAASYFYGIGTVRNNC